MKAQESKGATHGEGPVGKVSLLSLALGKKSLNALGLLIEELLEGPFQAILLVLDLHNHLANSVLQSRNAASQGRACSLDLTCNLGTKVGLDLFGHGLYIKGRWQDRLLGGASSQRSRPGIIRLQGVRRARGSMIDGLQGSLGCNNHRSLRKFPVGLGLD